MSQRRHRASIERIDNGPGVRLTLCVRPGRDRGRFKRFEPEDVPPFEERSAFFEIDLPAGRWVVAAPSP